MKKIKNCDKCPYQDLVMDFAYRVNDALKPAVKMWQKENNKPLFWPDPMQLIKWLTRRAK